jgi:molybdopterin converting factor small subunit
MVKAKLFGILRLNAGVSMIWVDADRVGRAIEKIAVTGKADKKELKNCIILVDGKRAKMNARLCEGNEIVFLSPAGGG